MEPIPDCDYVSTRKVITTKTELETYPLGSLVSYTNHKGIFKIAGFTFKYADTYFIYITLDFKTKYRVKYKNVLKMWIRRPDDYSRDLVSYTRTSQKRTKFSVKVGTKNSLLC